MDNNARNGSSVDSAVMEPSAPHDELAAELESYAHTLYEVATRDSVKQLNDGVRKALEQLEMSFSRAQSTMDTQSGELAEAIHKAQSDFRGMFDPVFEAYQKRFIEDQNAFLDLLLSRFSPVVSAQTEALKQTAKENAEYTASLMQGRYAETMSMFDHKLGGLEVLRGGVERKLNEMEAAQAAIAERFEQFAQENSNAADEMGKKVAEEVDKSVKLLFHTQAQGTEKATAAFQKAVQETQAVQAAQAKMQGLIYAAIALGIVNIVVAFVAK